MGCQTFTRQDIQLVRCFFLLMNKKNCIEPLTCFMASKRNAIIFYSLAAVCLVLYIILTALDKHEWSGWLLMLFFAGLAIAFRSKKLLKGLSFTLIIFAAVTLALYHPEYFQQWGGFKLSGLIIPLIQLIMFGMGTSMSVNDFASVIKTPKGVVIGVLSQFIIMPT